MAAPYETLVYPAFVSRVRNIYHAHALIKVPTEKWPDARLAEQLRGLPPNYLVNVSPESIL